jgi:hypothetical protein
MTNKIIHWIDQRFPFSSFVKHDLTEYPTPRNLSYWWNFGFLAGFVLVLQVATGVFLAMHYKADVTLSFDSIQHIMRDVNYGWLLRFMHATGASAFFLVIYIHMARTLYYGSYRAPRELMWWTGQGLLLLLMATAFMGYLLPWGQMSFWGATVITNLFKATPFYGEEVVSWLRGGFSVVLIIFQNPLAHQACAQAVCYRFVYSFERWRDFAILVVHDFFYHPRKRFAGKGVDEVHRGGRFSELFDQFIQLVNDRLFNVEVMQMFIFVHFDRHFMLDE